MSDKHKHSDKFNKGMTDISIVEISEKTKKLEKTNCLPNCNH